MEPPEQRSGLSGPVDMTIEYKRHSPFKCVLSARQTDYVCHIIYALSASEYMYTLYQNVSSSDMVEIAPGIMVPRLHMESFSDELVERYIKFAYTGQVVIDDLGSELASLLEFASRIISEDMLTQIEAYLCQLVDKMNFDQLQAFRQLAIFYTMDKFKQQLNKQLKDKYKVDAIPLDMAPLSSDVISAAQ